MDILKAELEALTKLVGERALTVEELSALALKHAFAIDTLRDVVAKNQSQWIEVAGALQAIAESTNISSEQAKAALTIVQHALVLRPVEPTEPE